jgi:exopolyphosphatase/guanosine-5'-triphosphate,3'-diphosphate pyrophosphatase
MSSRLLKNNCSNVGPAYAALDLGTNSCRMLIARADKNNFKIIDSFSKSVKLGSGLEESKKLSNGAMKRAISALKICQQKLNYHKVKKMRLIATEACRRAENSSIFINEVKRSTGLSLEIIPTSEEARFAVMSCAPLVDVQAEQILVIDIGGGSTELIWINLENVSPDFRREALTKINPTLKGIPDKLGAKVVDWISVPLGVVTLKDQYSDVDGDMAQFALMACQFEESLQDFIPYKQLLDQSNKKFQIIGTSGTITTIASSHLKLKKYDRNLVDGLELSAIQIEAVIREYLLLGPRGRLKDLTIGKDRQELIMSGAAILQTLLRLWPTNKLSIADRGLREGLLFSLMADED